MADDTSRGWWQATDGRWYPPRLHPDAARPRARQPVAAAPPGAPAPLAVVPSPPDPPTSRSSVGACRWGVGALLLSCVPGLGMFALPIAVVAICLGVVAIVNIRRWGDTGLGFAVGGLVCGVLAVVMAAIWAYQVAMATLDLLLPG